MSSTPQTPTDLPCKPPMRKYDKRKGNHFIKSAKSPGRKPNFTKNLSRNTAANLFRKFSIETQCAQLLESNDLRLRFEVIRYLWDRLEGKPFTAENPALKPQPPSQDNRLQVAIQNLIVPSIEKPKRKKQKALPVAESIPPEPQP